MMSRNFKPFAHTVKLMTLVQGFRPLGGVNAEKVKNFIFCSVLSVTEDHLNAL